MNLIIDFLNIKEWTVEALHDLHKKHGLYRSLDGQRRGHERLLESENFPRRWYYFESDEDAKEDRSLGLDKVFPEDKKEYQELFGYLKTLQSEWDKTIEHTNIKGPNLKFLESIMDRVQILFGAGENTVDGSINSVLAE